MIPNAMQTFEDDETTEQWQQTIVGQLLEPRRPGRVTLQPEIDAVTVELTIEEGPDPALFGAESCVQFPLISDG